MHGGDRLDLPPVMSNLLKQTVLSKTAVDFVDELESRKNQNKRCRSFLFAMGATHRRSVGPVVASTSSVCEIDFLALQVSPLDRLTRFLQICVFVIGMAHVYLMHVCNIFMTCVS